MRKNRPTPVSDISFTVSKLLLERNDFEQDRGPRQLFHLSMAVDGKLLIGENPQLGTIDGMDVWLAQRYDSPISPLTCSCGIPECAGFHDRVKSCRRGGCISWTFPESYFRYLKARDLAAGKERAITLHFDAKVFAAQFERALSEMRQFEKTEGKHAGFNTRAYGDPQRPLDEQFENARAWHLRNNSGRRFARYQGVPAGICAGATRG